MKVLSPVHNGIGTEFVVGLTVDYLVMRVFGSHRVVEGKMVMLKIGSRKLIRQVALIVAGAVLAMQFVLAVQACVLPLAALSAPIITAQCEGSGMSSGSCLIQCQKTADQIKPSVDFHFDALPTPHARAEVSSLARTSCAVSTGSPMWLRPVGPGLQILFCSFQS